MKKIFAISLGLFAVLACNKQNEVTSVTGAPIRFSVSGDYAFTKATEAALEDDDEVQIIAKAPVNAATKAVVDGAALNPVSDLYWGPGQTTATDFVAIYPYTATTATSISYNLFNENVHDYAYHKMFMTAHVSSAPTDESIVLPFKHPFSKVLVNITSNLGSDVVESVVIKGVKMEATLDLVSGAIDLGEAAAVNVPATKLTDNSYAMIVMPQSAQPTIEVTTHLGSVYTFALASAFNFEAGKVATASLTLAGQGGGGQDLGDPISFGFSVANWAAVETEPDFGQDNVAMGAYWYVIGCVYDNDNTVGAWGKDFPMTYKGQINDEDVWEVTLNYDESMAGDVEGSKGLKFRRYSSSTPEAEKWNDQLGMWGTDGSTYMNIAYDYNLATSTDGNKNVRFETAGNYKLTLTGNSLTVVKNQ